jgi:hypothetical protein
MANPLPKAGLCVVCYYHKVVISAKGSLFVLCQLAKSDSQFTKYPHLPVLSCPGFKHQNKEKVAED